MTDQEKLEKYMKGEYMFSPPAVCTAAWGTTAWIKYIDHSAGWR